MKKGDSAKILKSCDVVAEHSYHLPPLGHMAMEVRTAHAEISSDGGVFITSSSQSPYSIRKQISEAFLIPSGQIEVFVPFVGGAFGGKAPVMLEILAFLASRSVGGKPVRLTISREQDIATPPCHIGLEADIKIGATKDGKIQAAELIYRVDCGAYTDIAPYMAKAVATDCTGPYHIENLTCDVVCVYTNHTYATSFRSFAHDSYTFCIERTLDMLSEKCEIDQLEFRLRNIIRHGSQTPSRVAYTKSGMGDLSKCLNSVKSLSGWCGLNPTNIKKDTVRAKGVACIWKTENPPTDAISGALITFNPDGSLNLHTGVVEIGSNGATMLAQMLAEKLKIDADQVHIVSEVNTRTAPEHWKTVASLSEYMAGHAVMRAADDIVNQLRNIGAMALNRPNDEIEISHGRVFSNKNPERFITLKDLAQGYKSLSGESIGEPVLGRGGFMLKGLCLLNPETGEGKTGPQWTLGAQVVEVEADLKTLTYRIINASTVIDVGNAINPESIRAQIAGGMAMGISLSSREGFFYNENGVLSHPNFRSYKVMHIGQEPNYKVAFAETPDCTSPYGVRSFSEHGVIGMPAALGNALSLAFGKQLDTLPLTPENIWRTPTEDF